MGEKPVFRPEMGKWSLWRFFSPVSGVGTYLPDTAILNQKSLQNFLTKYNSVYIKPSAGWGGKGVLKVWKTVQGYSLVQVRGNTETFLTVENLYSRIEKLREGKLYIIQRAIDLAKVKGRPFDIRLMMIRDPQGKWQYSAMLAKVAGPSSIVTNVARGKGYVMEVEDALRTSLGASPSKIQKIKSEMITLGHKTCEKLDSYNRYWNLGLDLAVDKNGKVWMIEQNTGPAHSLFARLPNPAAYQRLRDMTGAYFRSRRKVLNKK